MNTSLGVIQKLGAIGTITLVLALVVTWFTPNDGDLYGIDYVHYQSMLRAHTTVSDVSIYDRTDHRKIFDSIVSESDSEKRAAGSTSKSQFDPVTPIPKFKRLLDKQRELYPTGLHPTGSPLLYAFWGVLSRGDFEFDLFWFQIANNWILFLGLTTLAYQWRGDTQAAVLTPFFIGLGCLFFRPLVVDLQVGNSNRFQVGMICFILLFLQKGIIDSGTRRYQSTWLLLVAGWLMGFTVLYKPNVLAFLLMTAASVVYLDRWRGAFFLVGTGLGFLAGWCFGCWAFQNASIWWEWKSYLVDVLDEPFSMASGNYSLMSTLSPEIVKWLSPTLMIGLAIVTFGWAVFQGIVMRRKAGLDDPLNKMSRNSIESRSIDYRFVSYLGVFGLLLPLLVAPLAWGHYFVLTLPALFLTAPQKTKEIETETRGTEKACIWWFGVVSLSGMPVIILSAVGLAKPWVISIVLLCGVASLMFLINWRIADLFNNSRVKLQ